MAGVRVCWHEVRSDREVFLLLADKMRDCWEFAERSTWELQWYPLRSTPELIAKAESISRAQGGAPALTDGASV